MRLKDVFSCLLLFWIIGPGVTRADDACSWVWGDKAIDGDTVRLQDGRWVRCAGIDTPEIDHQHKTAGPLGYKARDFFNQRVKGKRLCLKKTSEKYDSYGRILAYLFDEKGNMLNVAIVAQGLGHVYPHGGQDNAYGKMLLAAQRQAMRQHIGIWRHRLIAKGTFIGNRRSRRFHRMDCLSVSSISPKNRKVFASIREAYWGGYSPGRGCQSSSIKKELKQ